MFMLFQNKPVSDQRGRWGQPGARGHHVGDPDLEPEQASSICGQSSW